MPITKSGLKGAISEFATPFALLVGRPAVLTNPAARYSAACNAASAADVSFELPNVKALIRDDFLDEITNRKDAHHVILLDHWQMPDAPFRHQGHAGINALSRRHLDNFGRHDLGNARFVGRFAKQYNLARIIALREYSNQPRAIKHNQGADIMLGHQFEGRIYSGIWRDRYYACHFLFQ
jgi:hypothetical protein